MKLRLPHKFQAALMAALASVSITTLSSATAFAEETNAQTMHVYILTGQSNSLGAVKGEPLPTVIEDAYQSGVLLYNGNMHKDRPSGATTNRYILNPEWQTVAPQEPGLTINPGGYGNNPCMGPEYGFAYMMEKKGWAGLVGENDALAVVKSSLDGGGNGYWLQTNYAYQTLLDTVKLSITQAVDLGYTKISLDGLMYLQGESNKNNEPNLAATRFTDFLGYLNSDLDSWLETEDLKGTVTLTFTGEHANAVTGEPATWTATNIEPATSASNVTAAQMIGLATSDGKINADRNGYGFVYTQDLAKITSGDNQNVHYNGVSQLTIGARYAYAFAVQNGINVGTVRGQDDSKNLDDAAAWWMEQLPATDAVAVWDLSSVSHSIAVPNCNNIAEELTVGGIRIEDIYQPHATNLGQGTVAITGGSLKVGASGIELQGGNLTVTTSNVATTAAQTWKVAAGKTLQIGSADALVAFGGDHAISIGAQTPGQAAGMVKLNASTDGGHSFSIDDGAGLLVNADDSVWSGTNVSIRKSGSFGTVTDGDVTINSLTLDAGAVFDLGGGSNVGLHTGSLSLGGDATFRMNVDSVTAHDCLYLTSVTAASPSTVTFELTAGAGVRSGVGYVLAQGWDSNQLTAVSASDKAVLSVDESNQLIATFSGIADYTKPWEQPTGDPLTITASGIFDAAMVHGHATEDSSSLTQGNTASGVYFFASNTDGNNGQVYAELKDAGATWVVAAGHNSGGGYRNNMGGSYHVKVTGTQAVTYGGVYAVTNGTVQGDAYIELCNDAATYNGNNYGDAVNGIYNGTVEGSVTLLVRSGIIKDDITGGHFSASAGQHIGKGVFVQVDGGSVSGQVRGGGLNANGTINGGTHVLVNGGTFAHNVMGGGTAGTINDGTEVIIRGGTIQGDVMGGGTGGTIAGGAHVTITGGTINGNVYGGGTGGTITGGSSVTIEGNLATILGNISADTVTLQDISPNASGQQTVDKYHGTITADTVVLNKYNVERLLANLETKSLVLSGGTTTTIGNLTLTACDITVEEGSALTLENPVNLGYTTTYNGHVAIADGTLFNMQDAVMTGDISGYSEGPNGFAKGTLIVFQHADGALVPDTALYGTSGSVLTPENTATFSGSGILTGATFNYDATSGQLTAEAKGTGGPYYVNEGTVAYSSTSTESRVYEADDIRLNGGTLQFQEALKDGTALSVTKTGSGMVLAAGTSLNASIITYGTDVNGFDLSGEGELILTAANAEQLLTNVTGTGTMHLVESAVLNGVGATTDNPKASVSTGTFIVGNGAGSDQVQLQIGRTTTGGNYVANYATIKSFQHVTLDNGQLWFHTNNDNDALTVNGLTVTENGGSIYLQDVNGASTIKLAGTTNLQGDLSYTNNWKDNILDVDKLTGSGDFSVTVPHNSVTLNLHDVTGWSGTMDLATGGGKTHAIQGDSSLMSFRQGSGTGTYNFGTDGSTANFNRLTFEGSSAQVNIYTTSAAQNIHTNKLTLGSGMTLTAYYSRYVTADGLTTKLVADTLQLLGDATIKTTQHGGYMEFGSITGSGTLTIQHTAGSTIRDTVSVGGNPDVDSATFTGKLLINEDNTGGGRGIFVVLNDKLTMSQAQLELKAQNTGGTRYVGVGINADLVQLGALIDGDNVGNLTAYTLFSGDASGSAAAQTYSGYGSRGGMRTLEFTGADTYSTSIKVLNNISLAMSGTGSQSFTGNLSQFNGSINVTNGTLALTPNSSIATHAVNVGGEGTLTITTTGNNAITAFGTMVNEGNLSLTGTVALNSSDLSAYTVVAGTESNTKYSGTETYAGSGFLVSSAEYYLVKGNGTVSGTYNIDQNTGSIVEGKTDDHNVVVTFKPNETGGLYYVNDDFTYNATEMGSASGFVIAKGATLTTNSVSDVTNKVLHGSGSYAALNRSDNGPWSADNGYGLGVGVSLGTDWTGTVVVSGGAGNKQMMNLDILGNNGLATVEIKGLVGWSQNWNGTIAANIKLTDVGSTVAWSNGASTSGSATATFTGRWSGEGTFKRTGNNNVNYTYIGDISEWVGKFDMNGGNTTLTFAGSANVVNATIVKTGGTLGVVVDTDATFSKAITANTFTVNAGKTATLAPAANDATYNVGSITNNGTIAVAADKNASFLVSNDLSFGRVLVNDGGTLAVRGDGASRTFSFNELAVSGTGHLSNLGSESSGVGHQSTINIANLTNTGESAVLTMGNAARSSATVFNLDGGAFSGEIILRGEADNRTRLTGYQFNAAGVAADSIVTFDVLSGKAGNNSLGMGVGADITVQGIRHAEGVTVTSTIYSGKVNAGVSSFDSQGTEVHTITIAGAGSYATSATVKRNLNLVMNGEGTQTFSGDMSAFNGTITVNKGTLALTGSTVGQAGAVAVNGGRLELGTGVNSVASLAVGASGTLKLSEKDNAAVSATTITLADGAVLDLSTLGIAGTEDSVVLLKGGTVDATNLAGVQVTYGENDVTKHSVLSVNDNALVLTFESFNLVWDNNTTSRYWTTDSNWHTDDGRHVRFYNGDDVRFAAATTNPSPILGSNVSVGTMTVDSGVSLTLDTHGYDLTAENLVANGTTLTKNGAGTATFNGEAVSLVQLAVNGGTAVFNEHVTVTGGTRVDVTGGSTATFANGLDYSGTAAYGLWIDGTSTAVLYGSSDLWEDGSGRLGIASGGKLIVGKDATLHASLIFNGNNNNGDVEVKEGGLITLGQDTFRTTTITNFTNAGGFEVTGNATSITNLANSGTMTLTRSANASAESTVSGTFSNTGLINLVGTGADTLAKMNVTSRAEQMDLGAFHLDNGEIHIGSDNGNNRVRNFTTITVDGAGKLTQQSWNNLMHIEALNDGTGEGERSFTWQMGTNHNINSVLYLDGDGAGTFSGTFTADRTANAGQNGAYQGHLQINNGQALQHAVLNVTGANASNYMSVALNTDAVEICGLTGNENAIVYAGEANTAASGGKTAPTSGENTSTLTLNVAGGAGHTYSGKVLGGISLVKAGAGTQTFSGDMTAFNGTLTLNEGTLAFTSATTATGLTGVAGTTLSTTANLTVDTAQTSTFAGTLAGSGTFTKAGTGTLTLTAANTISGGVAVNAGTLVANNAGALGTGNVSVTGGNLEVAAGINLTLASDQLISNTGGTIVLNNGSGITADISAKGKEHNRDLGTLVVNGEATLDSSALWNPIFNIGSLSGESNSLLKLFTKATVEVGSIYNLNGTGDFKGNIEIKQQRTGIRYLAMNINGGAATQLQYSVVTLDGTNNNESHVGIGLGADATVRGISSTDGSDEHVIFSGAAQYNGEARKFNNDSTNVRKLTIATQEGDNFSTRAKVQNNVNLVKTGAGTQALSVDTTTANQQFNGSIDVEGGVLNIMNAASVTPADVTIGAGATMGVYTNGTATEANEGKVTIASSYTLSAGNLAKLNSDLEMAHGSRLDVSQAQVGSAESDFRGLIMGSSVTIQGASYENGQLVAGTGVSLVYTDDQGVQHDAMAEVDGYLRDYFASGNQYYVLFDSVEELYLNDATTPSGEIAFNGWDKPFMDANTLFNNVYEKTYAVVYSFNGSNVGTLAICLVPEPTTSTLSLLALAALAARRRKHN